MPKIARIEAVGYPYHVVQRGNRNQIVFFRETDKEKYLRILRLQCTLYEVEVWAYCLMDNHVHLIIMPKLKGALTECIREVHRSYTCMINFREGWRGHLWQSRFDSYPMDEKYLWAAVRYVERNPVRAGMVQISDAYKWSSAGSHVDNSMNEVLTPFYLMKKINDWRAYLAEPEDEEKLRILRRHQSTWRPLGDEVFVKGLEEVEGRVLTKQKPGPKVS